MSCEFPEGCSCGVSEQYETLIKALMELKTLHKELLQEIIDRGYDADYNCSYCGAKTYGTGKDLTCTHYSYCLWLKIEQAIKK